MLDIFKSGFVLFFIGNWLFSPTADFETCVELFGDVVQRLVRERSFRLFGFDGTSEIRLL